MSGEEGCREGGERRGEERGRKGAGGERSRGAGGWKGGEGKGARGAVVSLNIVRSASKFFFGGPTSSLPDAVRFGVPR